MSQDIVSLLVKYRTDTIELKRAKTATDELADKIRNTEVDVGKLDKEQRKTYKSIINNTNKAKTATDMLSGGIKSMIAGYLSFTAIKQATKLYADFDDQLKRTQALTGATATETMLLEKQSKELGKTTAFSASQVAQAQGNMAQTGLKVNEILAATPGILSLASAGQLDLATATDLTTSALNIFGLKADQSTRVADVLAKAQASSAGNAQWFGSALQNVGANAKSLGFSLESTTAILATMAPAFKEGGSAGTALNAILRDMTAKMDKQGQVTIGNRKVMVAQNGTMLSMDKIITNVSKATQGMTDVQKRQALATIFGDEAMRGFNTLLGAGATQIVDYQKKMDNASGTAKTMADVMESGLGGSLRTLQSGVEAATLSLVEALMPAIKVTVDTATGLASIANEVAQLYKEYPGIMWTVTGVLGVLIAKQKLVAFWNTVVNATNPWGWVKIAVTGVILALGYLEQKYKTVSKVISGIKDFFTGGDKNININTTTTTVAQATKGNSVAATNMPKYAKGTNDARGGLSLVGEQGPELVNIAKGSQVVPTERTRELLERNTQTIGGDTVNITVNSTGGNVDEIVEKITAIFEKRERRKMARTKLMLGGV